MNINLTEYFKITVSQRADKVAVIDGEREITFRGLDEKARALASIIINEEDCKNCPVALYLPKSIESVYADIAITYSGNVYMNLDIKTPQERIKNILELVRPRFIITNSKLRSNIENSVSEDITIIDIDTIQEQEVLTQEILLQRISGLIDTDPLCIINTSGSTGTPKAVLLNHQSYIDYTQWAISRFDFKGDEILGVLSPILFDHYNFEISLMMSKGVTLVLLDNNLAAFPVKILETLAKHKVSFIFWVPAIMVNIANMDLLSRIVLPNLKMVWFAGEVFPTKQFNIWRKCLPQATFVNLYGPVETTVDCTYYIVEREIPDNEPIPIGFPCRNTNILILNEQNEQVKQEEEGELCVRGTSLAMGYYNNPEKTAAAFVQNPLNHSYPEIIYRTGDLVYVNERGEIVFKGRKDSLIKHMGYRIELGEIEHVIVNQLKLVKNCCVVYHREKKEITLFYEMPEPLDVSFMRKVISGVFAKYMIPTVYIHMTELPRNTNGKIDRLLLSRKVNE